MRLKDLGINVSLLLSLVAHLLVAGWVVFFIPRHPHTVPVEIFLGSGSDKRPGPIAKGNGIPKAHKSNHSRPGPKRPKLSKATSPKNSAAVENSQDALTLPATPQSGELGAVEGKGLGTSLSGVENGSGEGGGGSNSPLARYINQIVLLIEKNKQYPKRAKFLGQEGTVLLRIEISKNGEVVKIEVKEAPPFQALVDAALKIIKQVGSFPDIPDDVSSNGITINVPINYKLTR